MGDEPTAEDLAAVAPDLEREWTQHDVRVLMDRLSDHVGEWQGLPVPLGADTPLVLVKDHPLAKVYEQIGLDVNGVPLAVEEHAEDDDFNKRVVNHWFSRRRNCEVWVIHRDGQARAITLPRAPDRSMERMTMWLSTMGAADAWDLGAEMRARMKLADMLTDRQWMHYDLTGAFFESSPRSGLTYVFRRLRPTLALSPRQRDGRTEGYMRCLGVLCLHPIGYYANSWAGCMVPSDDVIAHVSLMRGDEAAFWRFANLHEPSAPEAGL